MERTRADGRKRHQAVPIPDRNANKFFSCSEAWVRIKKARGFKFYLEAVTLEESIIADRLISFLVSVGEIQAESRVEKSSFGRLIQLWTKRVPQPVPVQYFPDLCSAVDEWRKHRNQVVHGMVKSMPGAQHGDVLDFLKEAEFVAFQGEALAHAVSEWVRRAKKQHQPQ
jgi:imidazolonepropionase-like amidohydrolase